MYKLPGSLKPSPIDDFTVRTLKQEAKGEIMKLRRENRYNLIMAWFWGISLSGICYNLDRRLNYLTDQFERAIRSTNSDERASILQDIADKKNDSLVDYIPFGTAFTDKYQPK